MAPDAQSLRSQGSKWSPDDLESKDWRDLVARENINKHVHRVDAKSQPSTSNVHGSSAPIVGYNTVDHVQNDKSQITGIHQKRPNMDRSQARSSQTGEQIRQPHPFSNDQTGSSHTYASAARSVPPPLTIRGGILGRFDITSSYNLPNTTSTTQIENRAKNDVREKIVDRGTVRRPNAGQGLNSGLFVPESSLIESSDAILGHSDTFRPSMRDPPAPKVKLQKPSDPKTQSHDVTSRLPPHLQDQTPKRQQQKVHPSTDSRNSTKQPPIDDNTFETQQETTESSHRHDAPSLPMNAGLGAKSVKSEFPYPCTYSDCTFGFTTLKRMKRHKKQQHDYCAECDIDFQDDLDLIQHRIDSAMSLEGVHIACNICGDEFGSSAGRDAHIKIIHRSKQHIICPGCSTIFERGANFASHVWNNRCSDRTGLVSSEVMSTGRAYAALDLERQKQVDTFGFSQLADGDDGSVTGSSITGGVAVSRAKEYSILDTNDAFGTTFSVEDCLEPRYARETGTETSERTDMFSSGRSGGQSEREGYFETFPPLQHVLTKTEEKRRASKDSPQDATNIRSTPRTWVEVDSSNRGYTSANHESQSIINSTLGSRRLESTDWDTFIFDRDLTDKYVCPFEKCGVVHEEISTLKAHLISGWHFGTDHRCVKCLRLFSSPVALIAHMESSNQRCNIRETQQYGTLMYVISGGFLDITEGEAGEMLLEDGQIKLVAPTKTELVERHKMVERQRQERQMKLKTHC